MLDMMKNPPSWARSIVRSHFCLHRENILRQCRRWSETNGEVRALLPQLEEELSKQTLEDGTTPLAEHVHIGKEKKEETNQNQSEDEDENESEDQNEKENESEKVNEQVKEQDEQPAIAATTTTTLTTTTTTPPSDANSMEISSTE